MPSAEASGLPATVGATGEPPGHDRPATRRRLAMVAVTVLVVVSVTRCVVEPVTVRGDSMLPTLHDGEHVIADTLTYRVRGPRRGEIVTTSDPRGEGTIVKRVVAIGGDTVGIEDGWLVVNGRRVDDPHADSRGMSGYFDGPVLVPTGFVYLLGDRRADSVDSRRFGPVRVEAIEGRIVGRG